MDRLHQMKPEFAPASAGTAAKQINGTSAYSEKPLLPTDDRSKSLLIRILVMTSFAYGIAQAVVAPLLPSLGEEYSVSTSAAAWMLTGFVIVASAVAPIAGKLGDMFGRPRVLRIIMIIFFAGTIVSAIGSTFPILIAGRAIQGVSSAVFPLAYGILRERLDAREIAGAAGLVSAGVGIGGSLGVAGAGAIADIASPRGTFILVALLVGVATLAVFRIRGYSAGGPRERIDVAGGLLMMVWVSSILLVVTALGHGAPDPGTAAIGLVAVVGLIVWIFVERRAKAPIVDLGLMSSLPVLCGNALAFLFAFVQFSVMVTVPAFVQAPEHMGFGFSASVATAGLYILPQTIAFMIANLFTGRTSRWPGSIWCILLAGVVVVAATMQLLFLHEHPWQLLLASFSMGLGIGLMYSHLPTFIVLAVRPENAGAVAGMNMNLRNIGGAAGAQLSAVLLAGSPGLDGFNSAFAAMGLSASVAVLTGTLLVAIHLHTTRTR
jgi:predicted MFS family arabinose efflux permease